MTRLLVTLLLMAAFMLTTSNAAEPILEARVFKPEGSEKSLKYRILVPKIEADERLPVILCLHGAGERGDDNAKHLGYFVPMWSGENATKYRAIFVVPQAPNDQLWASYGWSTKFNNDMQPEPSQSMQLVRQLVDRLIKELPIDANRVYVTGLSMGGYGTWEFAQRYPELVAAAAPVCGGGDPSLADRIKHVPVWAFHGAKDGVVKLEASEVAIEALKKAGAEPKFTVYPNVGHDSWNPAYRDPDLMKWLFEQRRKSP